MAASTSKKYKIQVLCRNPDDYRRETKLDLHKVPRNHDPALHPFEGAREYRRALNAVKTDRMFAKPFICGMAGHRDSVQCMAKVGYSLDHTLLYLPYFWSIGEESR